MWKELKKSSFVTSKKRSANNQVLIQSLLVTVTNALCWLPSSAIHMTSIVMETYPTILLIWNAILINPLNSVINPVIFCMMPVLKHLCYKAPSGAEFCRSGSYTVDSSLLKACL